MTKEQTQGFTLIELLVVIAIIGLLASVVLVSVNNTRKKARDARRLADMAQIQKALELYINAYDHYPDEDVEAGCAGWDTSETGTFINELVNKKILSGPPKDPAGTPGGCMAAGQYTYRYYRYNDGEWCNMCGNHKPWYVLCVNYMESMALHRESGVNHPNSPGVFCTDPETGGFAFNYSTICDWVAYKCETQ